MGGHFGRKLGHGRLSGSLPEAAPRVTSTCFGRIFHACWRHRGEGPEAEFIVCGFCSTCHKVKIYVLPCSLLNLGQRHGAVWMAVSAANKYSLRTCSSCLPVYFYCS